MSETNNAVSTAQLANRRGFLLGITLAEIMLITLFVLLLLFRHYQEKAEDVDILAATYGEEVVRDLVAVGSQLPPINPNMSEAIEDITTALVNCREQNSPECFAESDLDETSSLLPEIDEPETLEEAMEQISKLEGRVRAANDALREEKRKTGEKPFCSYVRAPEGSKKQRGRNISIGTFLIEDDGITLVARDEEFLRNDFVDFVGDEYDGSLAISEVLNWPLEEKLSYTEFGNRGQRFVDIGDKESDKRVRCRFGADYFYEVSEETDRAREKVFQEYFFLGSKRLTRDEYASRVQDRK